ncbi:uncharacterized protein Z518_09996 [Rhinocladiella mackenziei CBS 650.93]|uniref:Rhinocladiella mackenziei CBS 650.93 unplaced genomic scaffold supercont1.8, whole genome shotgun sequence n=1 Tax=Rhinocladiella mackenziei CBS 650.93 TaxID=1442369 RepID=A0A0D2ICF0_9EURO|nr:uncharacterized protein Z518_09996 [Rhinocladiella mackenziei CBS 650.93]KIX00931.1 hypothetical protein Z518_09996 [Rhinocladiella mackenziei CBS 650.93]
MGATIMTPPMEPSSPLDGGIRKRVCKACDRCRLKKSKCDGASPCSRCKADNAICVFGERKKSHDKVYPKGYVEMLESQQAQLVAGLQELYKRTQNGQGWIGSPLKETNHGMPLTHDILERLGALKQEGHATNDVFEEDLTVLQQKLIADGAGFMQRQPSHDSHSDSSAPSPIYEPVAQRPNFTNPFTLKQFPPTPPNQSPYPQNVRAIPPAKSQTYPHDQSNLSWNTPASEFDDSMDFINQFESPMMDSSVDMNVFATSMFQDQIVPAAINPCLTMKDWAGQEDLQRYFNPAMI